MQQAAPSGKYEFSASVTSADLRALFDRIIEWPEFRDAELPSRARIGGDKIAPRDWRSIRDHGQRPLGGIAFWDTPRDELTICPKQISVRDCVTFVLPRWLDRVAPAVDRIAKLPFLMAQFGEIYGRAWPRPGDQKRWGIYMDHGWGMMFRGAGHDRLVSRRWLDLGPWRVVHLPNDTTFVQFHDLSLTDPAAAWEQAKVGHERMGIGPLGGYIKNIAPEVLSEVRGLYTAETRTLEIVVGPGNTVSQQEMREACAVRLYHRDTRPASDRIEHIAFVFMDRDDAEAHLHELWLRELQCWYVDERGKHRLDTKYHPKPTPPAWVETLTGPENALPEAR